MNHDIWTLIFDLLDVKHQIMLMMTNTQFANFNITNLYNIKSHKITHNILDKLPHLKSLNLYDNIKVKNIDNLTNLTKLNVSGHCLISDISHLKNLIYLKMSNNYRIKKIPKSVKYLEVCGNCVIEPSDIKELQLIKLNTHLNMTFGNYYVYNSAF
jgi:hypothetical protein